MVYLTEGDFSKFSLQDDSFNCIPCKWLQGTERKSENGRATAFNCTGSILQHAQSKMSSGLGINQLHMVHEG